MFLVTFKFLSILFFSASSLWANEKMWVAEGDSLDFKVRGKAWVENGQVLKVEKIGDKFAVRGLTPGFSDFRNGDQLLRISVISRTQLQSVQLLTDLATKTLGLSLQIEEGQVVLHGELLRAADWNLIAAACARIQCQYLAKIRMSHELQRKFQQQIESELRQISAFPYRFELGDELRVFLPEKVPQFKRIQKLLARYGISAVTDPSSIEILPLVKVKITIAEVRRTELQKFGIEWPANYQAKIIPGTDQVTNPLTVALNALETSGIGRVLASPNLLCRSGKEAEFTAGGEIPIKIVNYKSQDIVWKRYGILLKVKPVADFSGRMSISVETEVSSLDEAHKVDGIPGIFTNRVQTHFDLTKPKTILLSGLLKKESSENSSGLPGLHQIPILGSLFGSKDYADNKTELMIFVRPEIVSAESGDDE